MVSTRVKENALRKAGVVMAPFPSRRLPVQERYQERGARVPQAEIDADVELARAVLQWKLGIDRQYEAHLRNRAAARDAPV